MGGEVVGPFVWSVSVAFVVVVVVAESGLAGFSEFVAVVSRWSGGVGEGEGGGVAGVCVVVGGVEGDFEGGNSGG